MPKTTRSNPKLERWIRQLREQEMPVFAQTARLIAGKAHDDNATAAELSTLILQDASMTTRLLRMANSAYYNPGGEHINTISRAIVVLGLNAVHKLCLCIAVLDSFSGPGKQRMAREMARAFHAALQAKGLAEQCGEKQTEEIFIATLLFRLGTLAVWCFAEKIDQQAIDKLERALQDPTMNVSEAESMALGFPVRELTVRLNDEWRLSPLLSQALNPRLKSSRRSGLLQISHDLAQALEEGWDSQAVSAAMKAASRHTGLAAERVNEAVSSNAKAAVETLAGLGASEIARLVPQQEAVDEALLDTARGDQEQAECPQPDAGLQLDVLRELSQMLCNPRPRADLFLQTTAEGIYRGVGMDRVLYALLTPDKKRLVAKYVLGSERAQLAASFVFDVSSPRSGIIARALQETGTLWVGGARSPASKQMLTAAIRKITGPEFLIAALHIGKQAIGCLYADRTPSGRRLDDEAEAGFSLFAQQACLGLTHIKR